MTDIGIEINDGIRRARDAGSEHLDPIAQGKSLAAALESTLIALALHHGCELDPQTERHSIAAIRDPIVPFAKTEERRRKREGLNSEGFGGPG